MWFYVIIFSLLGVFVVVAGIMTITRRNREMRRAERHTPETARRQRKSERVQSRRARRKRK
jgi:cytochrome c biogenesis protein ResB